MPPPSTRSTDVWSATHRSAATVHTPQIPRRSARMTHLCSFTMTHTKNTTWRWARAARAMSSTPKACGVLSHHPRRRCVRSSVAKGKRPKARGRGAPWRALCRAPNLVPGPLQPLAHAKMRRWPTPRWATFGEHTRVNSRECPSRYGAGGNRSSVVS